MPTITDRESRRTSGGFPVWVDEIDSDGRPTGTKVHHETRVRAQVVSGAATGEVQRPRKVRHPDADIIRRRI